MNEELKNISDMFLEVINTMKSNMSNFDYSGLKETIGDIEAMTSLLQEASGTYLSGFNKQLTGMIESLKIANVEGLSFLKQEAIKKIELEKINNIIDSFGDKFESVTSKSLSFIEKIPLLGNTIGSVISTKASSLKSELSDNLKSAFANGQLNMENFKLASMATFSSIGKMISSTFTAVLANPWILAIAGVLLFAKAVWDMFSQFDSAAADFRKETGLTTNTSKELEKISQNTYFNMSRYGVSLESAYAATSALLQQFKNTDMITQNMTDTVAIMSERFGVAVGSSAAFLKSMTTSTGMTDKMASDLLFAGKNLADAAKVPFPAIVEDIANNAEFIHTYFKGSGAEIMKAAVSAARLGVSLESMASSAESLLDFQSSVSKQMTVSALLGKSFDLNYARQLSFQGKIQESQEEMLRQTAKLGDFDSMNAIEKKAIADANGKSVAELSKMLQHQKLIGDMLPAQRKEYEAAIGVVEELSLLDKDRLLNNAKQNAQTAEINNQLSHMWVQFSKLLLPAVTALSVAMTWIIDAISWMVDGIESVISGLGSMFGEGVKLGKLFGSIGKLFSSIWDVIMSLAPAFKLISVAIIPIIKFLANTIVDAFTFVMTFISSLIEIASGFFDILSGLIIGIFTGDFSLVDQGVDKIIGAIKSIFVGFGEFVQNMAGNLFELIVWPFEAAWKLIAMAFSLDSFETVFGGIINYIKEIGNEIWDAITWPFEAAWDYLFGNTVWSGDTILGVFSAITNVLKTIGTMIIDAITWPYKTAWNIISDIFNADSIVTMFDDIISYVKQIGTTIIDAITWPFIKAWEFVQNLPIIGSLFGEPTMETASTDDSSLTSETNKKLSSITNSPVNEINKNTSTPVDIFSELQKQNNALLLKLNDVITAINSMTVTMDGRTVGKIIANAAPNAASTI